jgi:hypothetical protein
MTLRPQLRLSTSRNIARLPGRRKAVTIGIGVLCSSQPRPHLIRPDCVALLADTMGSHETDSTPELHKLFIDDNLYVACAGNIEFASEVISIFKQELEKLEKRTYGSIWNALNVAVHEHRMEHFRWDVIASKYSFSPGEVLATQQDNIMAEWQRYDPGIQLLVSTFHHSGIALLFSVQQFEGVPGWVHTWAYPGFHSIGSGAYNANAWLNYRSQQLGLNPRQSVYHAYEAKIMAEQAPTVNKNLEIVVAFAGRHYPLTAEKPVAEGCPISFNELKGLYKKLGPQDTNELGHSKTKQLNARREKGSDKAK